MKKIVLSIFFALLIMPIFIIKINAQTQDEQKNYRATVTQVLEKKTSGNFNVGEMFQKLELVIDSEGDLHQQKIVLENIDPRIEYKVGEKLMIYQADADTFLIADHIRTKPLLILFIFFILAVLLISRWRGAGSLLGMAFSFLVIIYFILPRIAGGANPILIAILGSFLIIPATFYPSHGINRKTSIAILSTVLALVITGLLANFFLDFAKLSGLASEEAGFLQTINPEVFNNMRGLLLAGIIIGVLGVLDDVTISQASIVQQLKIANPQLNGTELYKRAMEVGRDHIASMVNTLVLVYAGASLPLLLLFSDAAKPFNEIVNYEILADEIVRTLVGSIGLILVVPISTFLATIFVGKPDSKMSHDHLV